MPTLLHGQGAAAEALPVRELAPGLFVHAGEQAESSPQNLGDIANIGFIVGAKCVAVIDTGGSIVVGTRLREAVKAATTLPVCYVVNTHIHPDHIFGNAAFKADNPVYVGHARLAAAMAARGRNYRNALLRDVGDAVAASEIVPPTLEVKDAWTWISAAASSGSRRGPPPTPTTTSPCSTRAARPCGWRTCCSSNTSRWWTAASRAGSPSWRRSRRCTRSGSSPATARARTGGARCATRSVTCAPCSTETRAAIKAKRTMQQAVDSVGLGEKDQWLLSEGFHKRNVTAAYAELEWED